MYRARSLFQLPRTFHVSIRRTLGFRTVHRSASCLPGATATLRNQHVTLRSRSTGVGLWSGVQTGFCSPVSPLVSFNRGYADLPNHILVNLPALSPTMETGTILSWELAEGDEIEDGDAIAQVETDKATMDMEAPRAGYLAKIIVPAGSKDIPLGKLLCIIVENESDVAAFKDFQPLAEDAPPASTPTPEAPAPPPSQPTPSSSQPSQQPLTTPTGGRAIASPYAKNLASQQGINLQSVQGSGPGGRIVSKDLLSIATQPLAAAVASPDGGDYTDIELSNMRKTIAKRLQQSKQNIPHYYLTVDITVDSLLRLRQEFNHEAKHFKLSVNDFLIKAAALAMNTVPEVNSSWMETFIRQHHSVDICVAVSTDGGLITPIVFSAQNKGLMAINAEVKELAEKARSGRLQPREFQGGTFTISNLGMYGIKHFTAVINPPQSCILAVGGVDKRIIVDENSIKGFRSADVLTVTLSCDHRVVDGAVGAQWLATFKDLLEKPHTMLL
ncbi:dihydrolipoyllysine-residue acetyltransferase component of pyruvate dehydrogenase complex, mitochondrial-like [Halichondria panicea]|uniref:dihydrolipoyllysine-residue acetyltransferase component of pyruvate dehydrogenase complex, mitochondrial-like n=1 Tax=Halichondria panicea TaxID=6063 RepID=UPI00312B341D